MPENNQLGISKNGTSRLPEVMQTQSGSAILAWAGFNLKLLTRIYFSHEPDF